MTGALIAASDMYDKLLTVDQLRDRLAATERLKPQYFSAGDPIRFAADASFNHGVNAKDPQDPVGVHVTLGLNNQARTYQLNRKTMEEMCLTVGLKREYVGTWPAELIIPPLNHWYREGMQTKRGRQDYQLMTEGDQGVAFGKQGLMPFSNLKLVDTIVDQLSQRYGPSTQVLVDYKLHHTLRQTTMRLVLPTAFQEILPNDLWSVGVQVKNSLTGASQTSVEGYMFRWLCTNGQIDAQASSGAYTRRKDSTEDEAYAWARQAVDEALSGLDNIEVDLRRLADLGVSGSLSDTLRDIFEHYRIAIAHRPKIIRYLEEYDGEITMYVIMNAITQAANDPSLEPGTVESLLRVGGDFPYSIEQRCGACHRMMHSH